MTKQEFVKTVTQKSGLSSHDAGKAVDAFMETVTGTLQEGDSISFPGFGKFAVSHRAARMGVHPQTRQPMAIAASRVPRFTAGAALKKAVR